MMEQQSQSNTDPIKVECPHCGSDKCFKDSQELEQLGKIPEIVDSYMCVSCGYTTTTLNVEGSQMIKEYEETTAELIKELRWIGPNGLIWYPIILNFPSFGIIFPNGTDKSNWNWTAAPAVDIPEEEQKKYPIPGQADAYYTRRIDMKLGRSFDNNDFYSACKFIGFIRGDEN
jgi:hypothetical protein